MVPEFGLVWWCFHLARIARCFVFSPFTFQQSSESDAEDKRKNKNEERFVNFCVVVFCLYNFYDAKMRGSLIFFFLLICVTVFFTNALVLVCRCSSHTKKNLLITSLGLSLSLVVLSTTSLRYKVKRAHTALLALSLPFHLEMMEDTSMSSRGRGRRTVVKHTKNEK